MLNRTDSPNSGWGTFLYTTPVNGKSEMTPQEAANELGISRSRVYALIRTGRLPATRRGNRWYIREEDLRFVRDRPVGWPEGRVKRVAGQRFDLDGEPAIDLREAGRRLGISRVRVLQLIHDGRLPAEKVGNRWLVRITDLKLVRDRPPGRPRQGE